jgi:glycosyltransferase involved in cell wall biosynthesis
MAYPILVDDRRVALSGGAETQQVIVARALVRVGVRVSMVSFDFGQSEHTVVDGIVVHRAQKPEAGVPGLRFFHPRLTSMWKAMRAADADVYYQRSAGALTGIVVTFARMYGRKSVVCAANNRDFAFGGQPYVRSRRDRWLHRSGVRRADVVVAQNEQQRSLLQQNFARDGLVIPNCYERPGPALGTRRGPLVIWVGTIAPIKRPDMFARIAAALPQYRFRMIGGPRNSAAGRQYFQQVKQRAELARNLEILGHVAYSDIDRHFDEATVLVNTSESEGFPNTFLQAWSRGVPTVSLVDAGCREGSKAIGRVAASESEAVIHVRELLSSSEAWQAEAEHCRNHFEVHHRLSVVVADYVDLLRTLATAAPVRAHPA